MATDDGVTRVARLALAVGRVIEDGALGAVTAHSGTRIHALLVDASPRAGAVRVDDALGATLDIGIPEVLGHTLAGGGLVPLLAQGIQAAGTGTTGLDHLDGGCGGSGQRWELSI